MASFPVNDIIDHLCDTITISTFVRHLFDNIGVKGVQDSLDKCGVLVPFMKTVYESELNFMYSEMGIYDYNTIASGTIYFSKRLTLLLLLLYYILFSKRVNTLRLNCLIQILLRNLGTKHVMLKS